ncbi:hypothetical protein YPPY15_2776 [Yersinia pestis PY-15]|uniref:Uncharacterized protein n=3 Tax=Yersinia pestis TaxID=632 RepID=Q8CL79_YERPE|nr:hypothetical [Yersinia pestis KIM10+]ABG13740.1 conserved hypothetical protein [Yersinia pestis Antiqua]ABG18213.1 conserved hypothetical protein [Yersinia pestis Nepal516]ADV98656.1 hypothetical protein YPC_2065 [Yersinia pestis biovar Medievalis str. Harbin 35]EEO80135.1 hypothetical protein YPF_2951 [Yersinia pestis biovar Orientalis str. India 195]EEO84368.1 hypothetical protein YPH_0181 [Yersinia pestis biovar Orientalis str. PEXU2]EEO89901.1 hypothetical protein YPS_2902 [Yersinia pe
MTEINFLRKISKISHSRPPHFSHHLCRKVKNKKASTMGGFGAIFRFYSYAQASCNQALK